jgi:hypothetical protein
MLPSVLNGNITTISAGTRFLLAIVVCWFAGSLLTGIIDRYSRESRRMQALRMLASARRSTAVGDGNAPITLSEAER